MTTYDGRCSSTRILYGNSLTRRPSATPLGSRGAKKSSVTLPGSWERWRISASLISRCFPWLILKEPEFSANLRYADWTNCEEKLVWLSSKRDLLLKDEWFWIDDDIPETDELDELGVDPRRCIKVDPIGAHELVRLQEVLTSKLENKSERVGR